MPDRDLRLEVSLRLKAARYLAGKRSTIPGRQHGSAIALTTAELAAKPVVKSNGIAQNRIEDIEQMKVDARPMELEKLAEGLGVPASFLTEPLGPPAVPIDRRTAEELVEGLHEATRAAEQLLGRLGERIGRRELQSRRAKDHQQGSHPDAASGNS